MAVLTWLHLSKEPPCHFFFSSAWARDVYCFCYCQLRVWSVQTGVRYWYPSDHKRSRKFRACMCPTKKNKTLDLSSDLYLSTVWLQPMCLAFLEMYCTVCHSSRCGLTSSTVKTTGSRPAERQGWKTLQKWVHSIHPTPLRAPSTSSRLQANELLQVSRI